MTEDDFTDSPEFGWQEQDRIEPETTIAEKSGGGAPICDTGTETPKASPVTLAVGDLFRLQVADKTLFRANQQVWVENVPTSTGTTDLFMLVVSVVSDKNAIEVRALEAATAVLNTTNAIDDGTAGPIDAQVTVLGTANAEGALSSGNGGFTPPFKVENYSQIFRDPFAATGTAIKVPADFDKSGIYRETAQQMLTEHMTGIERSFLFGNRSIEYVTENGDVVPRRTTGGVEWFLKQYEAANSVYRGGTGAAALTANTDEDKRIIKPTAGALSWDFFAQTLMERLFRMSGNKSFEKICMCGSGFLGTINAFLESNKVTTNKNMRVDEVYGFSIVTWETVFGTVHFKTHPLFNNSAFRRYDAFFLDVGYLKYRPLRDRDTKRYKNRQANDEDRRKDEWLTEAGLELRHPKAHMMIKGLRSLTA